MTNTVCNCWAQVLVLLCVSVSVLANTEPNSASKGGPNVSLNCSQIVSVNVNYALSHSLASLATSGAAYDLTPAQAANSSPTANPNTGSSSSAFSTTTKQQLTAAASTWGLDFAADSSSGCAEQQQNHPTPPHKALWPLSTRDIATLLLTCITLFIAAGGGIGGGAVFVVLYVFIGGFTAPQAVALSNITILGGSVANFLANTSRRHPVLDRPLIDWDLIMVMEPTTMLGALLGGYLNKLFPGWLTSCLLAALLSLLTYKLLKRGASTFRSESRQKHLQQLLQQQEQQDEEKQQQRPAAAAAADGLQEPLLTAGSYEEDVGMISTGGMTQSTVPVKVTEVHVDHVGTCFDAQTAGDQQQQQQQCYDAAAAGSYASAGDLGALVLQVPGHLKRLKVTTEQQQQRQHVEQQQQEQEQQEMPRSLQQFASSPSSCHALNVVTPRSQQQQQQQRWHCIHTSPISAGRHDSGAAAATASTSTLFGSSYDSQTVLLLPQYQQHNSHSAAAVTSLISSSSISSSTCCLSTCCSCFDKQQLELSTVLNYERQQLPWQPLVTLFFLSAWVVISDTSKVVMICGSLAYWLVVLSIVPPALLVMMLVRQWLLAKTSVKEDAAAAVAAATMDPYAVAPAAAAAAGHHRRPPSGMQQQQQHHPLAQAACPTSIAAAAASRGAKITTQYGGIHWTPRNSLLYPLLCSAAGVVAGLFGVGGGIVKGPLMLELGVCPEVAAATSATMIMFTAGSAAVVYINFGGVVTDYALAFLTIGFLFTLLGQLFTIQLVKALGRRSVIVFMMGTLMVLATVAASYQSVIAVDAAVHNPRGMWTWGWVCKHH